MEPVKSTVSNLWQGEQCPIEYGIYFADDTFIAFTGLQPSGKRVRIDQAASESPACLDPIKLFEEGPQIFGGATSWEGDGFLAVCDSEGALQWLLHCEGSEPFRSAKLVDGIVIAVSEEYPLRYEWRLPLDIPWECGVAAAP